MKVTAFYHDVKQAYPERTEELPSIQAQQRTSDRSLIRVVADYLDGGVAIGRSLGTSVDVFDSEIRTSLDTLTDGEWVWPGDAAHYCRTYGILPSSSLVEKAIASDGVCPVPSEADLRSIESEWFRPSGKW